MAAELPVAGEEGGSVSARLRRLWRHRWGAIRESDAIFDQAAFDRIEAVIGEGERRHRGEVRFAIEPTLDPSQIWAGLAPRERAVQVFSEQGIWDTEENAGILLYLLWADHAVEIVADRGADRRVPPGRWQEICTALASACRDGRALEGVLAALAAINDTLAPVLPVGEGDRDELPNAPIVL